MPRVLIDYDGAKVHLVLMMLGSNTKFFKDFICILYRVSDYSCSVVTDRLLATYFPDLRYQQKKFVITIVTIYIGG